MGHPFVVSAISCLCVYGCRKVGLVVKLCGKGLHLKKLFADPCDAEPAFKFFALFDVLGLRKTIMHL